MATIANRAIDDHAIQSRAIADFDEAIRLDPSNADAYLHRGIACRNLSDFDRAIADFDEAIRLDPSNADAYLHRGLALQARAEGYFDVIRQYDMVVTISAEVRDLLARLAAESGGTEFDVMGKAIALYAAALDARKDGLRIGLFDDELELDREIAGL